MKRLLVLSHGHPTYSKGGGEHAAYALHQAIGALQGWQSLFVAAAPDNKQFSPDQLHIPEEDPSACLVAPTTDWLLFESVIPLGNASPLKRLVLEWSPDVVHVHHFHRLGLDLVLALRHWCPDARLVFTLHEFLMLCPFQGQLLTPQGDLCRGPSPEGCGHCLPLQDSTDLELRDGLMRALVRAVDVFVAPSQCLADLFQTWAGDCCLVRVIPNCPPPLHLIDSPGVALTDGELPCRFGFFGNPAAISKGLDLVLEAFREVCAVIPHASLLIGGALPRPAEARSALEQSYLQRCWELVDELGASIHLVGAYAQSEVTSLMGSVHWVVMGSRWLENAPVVIEEAKLCRRPLLVPGHGGMAELVTNGRDGLSFPPGNAVDMAQKMIDCCRNPVGWQHLVENMSLPVDHRDVVESHLSLYEMSVGLKFEFE